MDAISAVVGSGRFHYGLCVLLVSVAVATRRSVRARQLALLLASWIFYAGWGLGFASVLLFSSFMNYLLGVLLRRRATPGRLWAGIGLNLALLGFFKYGTSFLAADPDVSIVQQLVRPIGMSFWTLQAVSYLIDIYRDEELDPSLLEFCLFMAFAPTVLAGPICRLSSLLPQLRRPIQPTADDLSEGATRVLLGLFMKMVVAEILAVGWSPGAGVDAGFDRVNGGWGGVDVWFLAIGFGFQLFFDFAGYSHVVIGVARLIGIRLDENFAHPYLARTPAAFWTRWHMSLSSWIADYFFLPMASIRRGRWWVYFSLLTSMVLCGIWHEATAGFIVWGAYHGVLLISHRVGQQIKRVMPYQPARSHPALSGASTFVLISMGWLFFRAGDVTQALRMWRVMLTPSSYSQLLLPLRFYALVIAVGSGWAAYHIGEALLNKLRFVYSEATSAQAQIDADRRSPGFNLITIDVLDYCMARKWLWLAPAMIVMALFTSLAVSDLRPAPPRTPFMYTLF